MVRAAKPPKTTLPCLRCCLQLRGPPKKAAYSADGTHTKALEGFCKKNGVELGSVRGACAQRATAALQGLALWGCGPMPRLCLHCFLLPAYPDSSFSICSTHLQSSSLFDAHFVLPAYAWACRCALRRMPRVWSTAGSACARRGAPRLR